jgi:hypothetical protein
MISTANQLRTGVVNSLPSEDYHGDHSALSKSMLSTFHKRKKLFQQQFVLKTLPPREPTASMELGTVAHAAILEPDKLDGIVKVIPDDILASNGAATTKAAKEFVQNCREWGKIPLKADQYEVVKAMTTSVMERCGQWMKLPKQIETSIYWEDLATQLRCKCRPDWLIVKDNAAYIFDLKTTSDCSPRAFRSACEDFDYALQHAHYVDGIRTALEVESVEFIFIAVETKPPYSTAFYSLDVESQLRGTDLRNRLLREIIQCEESGDYREQWEKDINPLSIREFAFA